MLRYAVIYLFAISSSYRVVLIEFDFYTHAATASQPSPLRVIAGSSVVKSKIVDTSYVGSSPVSMIMSTKLLNLSNSSTLDKGWGKVGSTISSSKSFGGKWADVEIIGWPNDASKAKHTV
jgi:hypothetical protein